jgi:Na+-transporting methylmalonyl-CoA/oxaloacetate decarboxylase gamma subunit
VEVALIIVVAVLFVLVAVVMLKGRRARGEAWERKQGEARVTAEKAKGQQERSAARQADVRAAHPERASNVGSDSDD